MNNSPNSGLPQEPESATQNASPDGRTDRPADGPATTSATGHDGFACQVCGRNFTTKTGLGVHRRRAHPIEENAVAEPPQVKRRWTNEEVALLARAEARLLVSQGKVGNSDLLSDPVVKSMGRTLEAIKGKRRSKDYKEMVTNYCSEYALESSSSTSCTLPSDDATTEGLQVITEEAQPTCDPLVPNKTTIETRDQTLVETRELDEVVEKLLLEAQKPSRAKNRRSAKSPPYTVFKNCTDPNKAKNAKLTSRQRRRQEYARVQALFKKCRSRAAAEIINGEYRRVRHTMEDLESHWRPIFESGSGAPGPSADGLSRMRKAVANPSADSLSLMTTVSVEEVKSSRVHIHSAAGPDGISAGDWNKVPAETVARLFSMWLARGEIPERLRKSRTIFVPKKDDPKDASDYRPISIASVPLRHLHTILARRLLALCPPDIRQRGFICADGTLENTAVLDAVLGDSRKRLRECHVAVLDFSKAFDTLSHAALVELLRARGLPGQFCDYIAHLYGTATTAFTVGDATTASVAVGKGVRQGDPMSPMLFNLAMDYVLANLPQDVGYRLEGDPVSALAYADDLVLIAGSRAGMQASISAVEQYGQMMGLRLNHTKCSVLSMVPDGKRKKVHYLTNRTFRIGKRWLKQVSCVESWRYLGVDFVSTGAVTLEQDVKQALVNITRAPLKPQQRLELVRGHLVPKFLHSLVLGNVSAARLKAIDVQIREAVRKWLRLPHDVPTAYFHAASKDGGLAVPALRTCVPDLILRRIGSMSSSSWSLARTAVKSDRIRKKLRWAKGQICGHSSEDPEANVGETNSVKCYWREGLHASVDGFELRETSKCPASTKWIRQLSERYTGRDYVQFVHTHINALPSKIRSTRGRRQVETELNCRAGCMVRETTAHTIQQCHRTHGGRILRHNAIAKFLLANMAEIGWNGEEEPRIVTACGLRKPDIIAARGGEGVIVDVQVVSGQRPLDDAHREKRAKYGGHAELVEKVAGKLGLPVSSVRATSCTLSWRGVWSCGSYKELKQLLGLKETFFQAVPALVLRGSHTNWTRFNSMTTRRADVQ